MMECSERAEDVGSGTATRIQQLRDARRIREEVDTEFHGVDMSGGRNHHR